MTGKAILEINYKMRRFLSMRFMDGNGHISLGEEAYGLNIMIVVRKKVLYVTQCQFISLVY